MIELITTDRKEYLIVLDTSLLHGIYNSSPAPVTTARAMSYYFYENKDVNFIYLPGFETIITILEAGH